MILYTNRFHSVHDHSHQYRQQTRRAVRRYIADSESDVIRTALHTHTQAQLIRSTQSIQHTTKRAHGMAMGNEKITQAALRSRTYTVAHNQSEHSKYIRFSSINIFITLQSTPVPISLNTNYNQYNLRKETSGVRYHKKKQNK